MKCFSDAIQLLTDDGVSDTVKNAQTGGDGIGGDIKYRELISRGFVKYSVKGG